MSNLHKSRHLNGIISFKIVSLDDVFDPRDSDTLLERRLDPDWLDYIFNAVEEKHKRVPIHLSLRISKETLGSHSPSHVIDSIKRELRESYLSAGRKLRENFRVGRITLTIGLLVLAFFEFLSIAVYNMAPSDLTRILSEGFLVFGWVALWRPVEILLYDWWPIADARRDIKRLLQGTITLKVE